MGTQKRERLLLNAALCVALAMVVFCAGYFIGRSRGGGVFEIYGEPAGLIPATYTSPASGGEVEADGLVNINTAASEELQRLPGIGPALAQRIIDFREEYGYFTSLEDLGNVKGIGDKVLGDIKGLVCW